LHIRYQPPAVASVPSIPQHPSVHHTRVDAANCTRSDEVQADLSAQIGQGLGDLSRYGPVMRKATTPNLIVETETEYHSTTDKP